MIEITYTNVKPLLVAEEQRGWSTLTGRLASSSEAFGSQERPQADIAYRKRVGGV